jgi:hypothetical protein
MNDNWRTDMENAPKDRDIIGYIPDDKHKPVRCIWWATDGGVGYWATSPGPLFRGIMILPESVKAWHEMPPPPHS